MMKLVFDKDLDDVNEEEAKMQEAREGCQFFAKKKKNLKKLILCNDDDVFCCEARECCQLDAKIWKSAES